MFGQATRGPPVRALHRFLLVAAGVHQRGQFVEREDDVGADLVLDPNRHLGCEPVRRSVQVRREGDAVVVDAGQPLLALGDDVVRPDTFGVHREHLAETRAQRQDLETAAVGEGRALPIHECAQSACLLDDVGTWL